MNVETESMQTLLFKCENYERGKTVQPTNGQPILSSGPPEVCPVHESFSKTFNLYLLFSFKALHGPFELNLRLIVYYKYRRCKEHIAIGFVIDGNPFKARSFLFKVYNPAVQRHLRLVG